MNREKYLEACKMLEWCDRAEENIRKDKSGWQIERRKKDLEEIRKAWIKIRDDNIELKLF